MKTVGVFDSGVGGLSVLRALLAEMPGQRFVYAADSAYAPYGERTAEDVSERTHRVTQHLREAYAIDALVVACNTATAHAIDDLRRQYPHLPIVGVEPALKPAASLSRNGRIGVLATRGTLGSARVAALRDRLVAASPHPLHFRFQPCDGLAGAIERHDTAAIETLSARYVNELLHGEHRDDEEPIDTVVLGCTHYPFAADLLGRLCGQGVMLVETGVPVARRTRDVLELPAPTEGMTPASTTLLSTGDPLALAEAAHRWLGLRVDAQALQV